VGRGCVTAVSPEPTGAASLALLVAESLWSAAGFECKDLSLSPDLGTLEFDDGGRCHSR